MDFRKTLWISHSAITDFNSCSRLYYFKSVYRNPQTGNRVQIVNPYLSLGSAVHETIDELLDLSPSKRINASLSRRLERIWKKYEGKKGGFISGKQENEFKQRGTKMLKRVEGSDMLSEKSLEREKSLPKMSLSEGVELVGSFDWIEVLKDGSLHIIDFKTGKKEENEKSLQLPIYHILAQNNYGKKVKKLSYWYLEKNSKPTSKKVGDMNESMAEIKFKSEEMKRAVDNSNFSCSSPYHKCFWCRKYESVLSGKAEFIGTDEKMKKDLYYLADTEDVLKKIYDEEFLDEKEKDILKIRMENGTVKEARDSSGMSKKQMEKTISKIKIKIKENLSSKELKVFVEELSKNGNKFEL